MSGTHDAPRPCRLAAIDLGSNSFHLLIANYFAGQLHVASKLSEKVQLAAGLDEQDNLDEAAMNRALDCLTRFAPFVNDGSTRQIRVVGTNALRSATNSQVFIERAEALLGHEVEIIAGREEARLIYLGAAHALADVQGRRLIVDIGGGSTELIIGENFDPLELESLHMGCVAYTLRFFADGEISAARFRQAELAALSELSHIRRRYLELGWIDPVGSSGTIKAVISVLNAGGASPDGKIHRRSLEALRQKLIAIRHLDGINLEGLKADRARIFPAGVAILCAIFKAFDLPYMRYSDGALREGVLYDLAGRNTPEDARLRSLANLHQRYAIDAQQADNVAASAACAFRQIREAWRLEEEQGQFLHWAAELHEIGLAISHSHFHRHGAYLIEHADLSGFSRPEQHALALLVRAHRRQFPLKAFASLPSQSGSRYARLARLLRLAVTLNHSRPEQAVCDFTLRVDGDDLYLSLPGLEEDHALLLHDLQQERIYQQAAGFRFEFEIASTTTVS